MAHDRSTTDAILTEHFRYTPLSVIDLIIDTINEITYKALTALEAGLLAQAPKNLGFAEPKKASSKNKSKTTQTSTTIDDAATAPAASDLARAEIENGTHALETLLSAAVDKNFDLFELYALQHIFSIDPGVLDDVRLKHYEGLQWPLDDASVVPETITRQREELRRERELGLVLEAENNVLDNVLVQLRGLVGKDDGLGILGSAASVSGSSGGNSGSGGLGLATTAEFTSGQLPGLRLLVRDLKAKMALIPASAEELKVKAVPGSTSDGERKRYVESVAQRAVRENLGSGERRRTGLGPGRAVEEVKALEGLLGGRGEDDDVD